MRRTLYTMAALAILPLAVGCTTSQSNNQGYASLGSSASTIRAQSPQVRQVNYQCSTGQCGPAMGGACQTCPTGACQSGSCQSCQSCPPGGCCSRCGLMNGTLNPGDYGVPFHPRHRNYYTLNMPQNLRYPNPTPTPMAGVNYPYYTTKGPTDFFYKGSSKP